MRYVTGPAFSILGTLRDHFFVACRTDRDSWFFREIFKFAVALITFHHAGAVLGVKPLFVDIGGLLLMAFGAGDEFFLFGDFRMFTRGGSGRSETLATGPAQTEGSYQQGKAGTLLHLEPPENWIG